MMQSANEASNPASRRACETEPDAAVVRRVVAGELQAFDVIMQRYNQGLYRLARSIVRDDDEAMDVVQDAYISAYLHLTEFQGPAGFATWMYTITRNHALTALRQRDRERAANPEEMEMLQPPDAGPDSDPDHLVARTQVRRVLDEAVDSLPEAFRTVFVLRAVNGLSVRDTAAVLQLREETVKTRLFRAKRLLREAVQGWLSGSGAQIYEFGGGRCETLRRTVLQTLGRLNGRHPPARPVGNPEDTP